MWRKVITKTQPNVRACPAPPPLSPSPFSRLLLGCGVVAVSAAVVDRLIYVLAKPVTMGPGSFGFRDSDVIAMFIWLFGVVLCGTFAAVCGFVSWAITAFRHPERECWESEAAMFLGLASWGPMLVLLIHMSLVPKYDGRGTNGLFELLGLWPMILVLLDAARRRHRRPPASLLCR